MFGMFGFVCGFGFDGHENPRGEGSVGGNLGPSDSKGDDIHKDFDDFV